MKRFGCYDSWSPRPARCKRPSTIGPIGLVRPRGLAVSPSPLKCGARNARKRLERCVFPLVLVCFRDVSSPKPQDDGVLEAYLSALSATSTQAIEGWYSLTFGLRRACSASKQGLRPIELEQIITNPRKDYGKRKRAPTPHPSALETLLPCRRCLAHDL